MAKAKILKGLLTEQEVCDILRINKERLTVLRKEKAFPYTDLSEWSRVYLEKNIIRWVEENGEPSRK